MGSSDFPSSSLRPLTAGQIQRALRVLQANGVVVTGAKLMIDGSVELVSSEPSQGQSSAAASWIDLAGDDG